MAAGLLQHQAVWQWPGPKNLPGDAIDELCCWCHEWATTHSSCGNRYSKIQGVWVDTPPASHQRSVDPDDEIDVVPICDRCTKAYGYMNGFESGTNILVLGHWFKVDVMFRMND